MVSFSKLIYAIAQSYFANKHNPTKLLNCLFFFCLFVRIFFSSYKPSIWVETDCRWCWKINLQEMQHLRILKKIYMFGLEAKSMHYLHMDTGCLSYEFRDHHRSLPGKIHLPVLQIAWISFRRSWSSLFDLNRHDYDPLSQSLSKFRNSLRTVVPSVDNV